MSPESSDGPLLNRRRALGLLAGTVGATVALPALSATASPGGFPLGTPGTVADLYLDADAEFAVSRALADLGEDLFRVTGRRPRLRRTTEGLSPFAVLVGTLGRSPVIDALVAAGRLDVADVSGRWEASVTQVVDAPTPGVERALVIAGSDRRGTIYGLYDLSERIGVSPWYWWADVPVRRRETLFVERGPVKRRQPSVRYRGIFINDEQNLTTWSNRTQEPDKHIGPETYKRVFELLLRLKANYLWPAMHPYTDHFNKYPENARLADEYGIVVGSSHPEAMLRNNVGEWEPWAESHRNPDGSLPEYDYTVNPEVIAEYWRERARQNAHYESTWTVGMRGIHDSALQTRYATTIPEKVAVMNRIISDQRAILRDVVDADVTAVPQIFIPYKEVLELYNNGVQVPDDVTLVWPDDNHGNMRQLPTDAERARRGGNGLYYHISYYGRPKSYIWLDTTPLPRIWQELRRAYDHGVDRLWVINVGDIKPGEVGLEFIMNLAWDVQRWRADNVEDFLSTWAAREFGARHAAEIAAIRRDYYRLAVARRPEFSGSGVFSQTDNGDESLARTTAYRDLLGRAEAVSTALDPSCRDAFHQLVGYPVHASYAMALKFHHADRNALAVKQGRGADTNRHAALAEAAQAEEDRITAYYNTAMAGGKWNGIMNPYPSQLPKVPRVPTVTRMPENDTAGLGVAAEGNETGTDRALSLSSLTRDRRFVDVYNTGFRPLDWTAATSARWIRLSSTRGTISDRQRLWIDVDWRAAPAGRTDATVTITGAGRTVSVPVLLTKVDGAALRRVRGFAEANGYVSIEAEHFDENVRRGGAAWEVVRGLGRNGDAVLATPSTAAAIAGDPTNTAPELRYHVSFTSTGTFRVTVFRLPSLDERGTRRLAIGLDDGPATILAGQAAAAGDQWSRNVVEGVEKLTGTITVAAPGPHVLRLWTVDPAMAVDQIVIDTGGLRGTYLAPPESYHARFNPRPGSATPPDDL